VPLCHHTQYAGTHAESPSPFLVATIVPRGRDAPISAAVQLLQPDGGSPLHAGGTHPAGFWSGTVRLQCSAVQCSAVQCMAGVCVLCMRCRDRCTQAKKVHPCAAAAYTLQAVLSNGSVFTVDRVDVPVPGYGAAEVQQQGTASLRMPSLMWTEVAVQVRRCTDTVCYDQGPLCCICALLPCVTATTTRDAAASNCTEPWFSTITEPWLLIGCCHAAVVR
jgi:hypothetical protein